MNEYNGEKPNREVSDQDNLYGQSYYNSPSANGYYQNSSYYQNQQNNTQSNGYSFDYNEYINNTYSPASQTPPRKRRHKGIVVFATIICVVFGLSLATFAGVSIWSMMRAARE